MSESLKFLGFRLPPTMAKKLEVVLKQDGLQVSEYVRQLMRDDFRKRGLLPPNEQPEPQPSTTEVGA